MELFTEYTTITACIILGLMWAVLLCQAFSWAALKRIVKRQSIRVNPQVPLPPVSIVITAHDQARELERNLPMLLEQDYPDFEVVVVNNNSTDYTEDVLKRMELKYSHLRHTFTPQSSRYISQRQLALTLGIRSAAYEWVALTDADCAPVSALWLQHLAVVTSVPGTDVILGYANFSAEHKQSLRCTRFQLLHNRMQALCYATRHGAYRYGGPNLLIRKSMFLQVKGFADYNQLLNGAEEIFVSRSGKPGNTGIAVHSLAVVHREPHTLSSLYAQERLDRMETRRYLRHGFRFRLSAAVKCAAPWVALGTFAAGVSWTVTSGTYQPALASSALYLAYLLAADLSFNASGRLLGERPLHFSFFFCSLAMPFLWVSSRLRYCFTPRKVFLKKAV